jgi:hypothetical protein
MRTLGIALMAGTLAVPALAQEDHLRKPKVDIVTVVGCAAHPDAKTWLLTNATDTVVTPQPFTSEKEVAEAKNQTLGTAQYRLIGTNEFGTIEELLKDPARATFTTRESANTTGTLQAGRKVVVKGLLIVAPDQKRLNLLSVQSLANSCP